MRITTKDIARICCVSRGTVDRALHNRPGINPETKKQIIEKAKELGYRPNMVARSLVKGQTMSIGVVVFDLYNRFFAQLLNSIEQRARERGYFTYVTLTQKDPQVEKECLSNLVERNVDGIILFSVCKGKKYEEFLRSLNKPIITVGNIISHQWPFVGINYRQGIKDAVESIARKGYERIIYVSTPLNKKKIINMYALEERCAGYLEACNNMDISQNALVIQQRDYLSMLDKVLYKDGVKTAVLCSGDIYALEILLHLKGKGIRVPGEIGLMGFDDIDILKYVTPAISTVSYSIDAIGCYAVDYLIRSIKREEIPMCTYLEHRVVIRDSL